MLWSACVGRARRSICAACARPWLGSTAGACRQSLATTTVCFRAAANGEGADLAASGLATTWASLALALAACSSSR